MGFTVSKYKQRNYEVQLSIHTADYMCFLLAELLDQDTDDISAKIQQSVHAEIYNKLVDKINSNKKEVLKLKLLYHQAVALQQLCLRSEVSNTLPYQLGKEKLADDLNKQL